jgi:hypothetical protein
MNGTRRERSADYMWRRLECTALRAPQPQAARSIYFAPET